MTDARIITNADAVKTALNGATFSKAFTSARSYRPEVTEVNASTLSVYVIPKSETIAIDTRSRQRAEMEIDVAILINTAAATTALLDPYMLLAQEIKEFFFGMTLSTGAVVTGIENNPIWNADALDQLTAFQSVITLTLVEWRDL